MEQPPDIIFTIARMNPPTSGHRMLIKLMMEDAVKYGLSNIFLILSSTLDNKKNPITCEDITQINKRTILENYIIQSIKSEFPQLNGVNVEIICLGKSSNPILTSIFDILKENGYPERIGIKMKLFIGEDRRDSYNWIQDKLSTSAPPVEFQIEALPRPEGAISATIIRQLALDEGKYDEFKDEMEKIGINNNDVIVRIYKQIRYNIKIPKPKETKKTKTVKVAKVSPRSPVGKLSSISPKSPKMLKSSPRHLENKQTTPRAGGTKSKKPRKTKKSKKSKKSKKTNTKKRK